MTQRQVERCRVDYTRSADSYDEQRFQGSKNEYLEGLRRSSVLKLLSGTDHDSPILDVASGTGRGLQYLLSAGYGNLTALDYTTEMLEHAKRKLATTPYSSTIRFIRGDAFRMPFASATFDLVITLNFVHLFRLQQQQRLIREMCRVSRPGALIVAEFENVHKGLFVSAHVERLLGRGTLKRNSAREIRHLFDRRHFSDMRVLGTNLPVVHHVLKHAPRVGTVIESITHLPLLKWTAGRVIVAARRNGNKGFERS